MVPCVVFGYNRPEKLQRVLQALRGQKIDRLIIFIDGPRQTEDESHVNACRMIAKAINWVPIDLHIWSENRGLAGLWDNFNLVFEQYTHAIFLEDDCLPMPGFYQFMQQALEHYEEISRVFSIAAYQPVSARFFKNYPYAVVGSLRFIGWGWGTWRNRWQELSNDAQLYSRLFEDLKALPDLAGTDLRDTAQLMASGQDIFNWDTAIAIASLHQKRVHILAAHGLVRNIGINRKGSHGSYSAALSGLLFHNRNIIKTLPEKPIWSETINVDCDYAVALRNFVSRVKLLTFRSILSRGRTLFQRYIWPRRERFWELNLTTSENPSHPNILPQKIYQSKRALLSYIVHPFSITRYDPRFFRHTNIFHAQEIVRALNDLGYRVDVIDYRDIDFIPQKEYDLFIGHDGINFEHIASRVPSHIPKIYFSTTSYWRYNNQQEQSRLKAFEKRRGVSLPPDRQITPSEENALRLADGIIGIGNETTRQTYSGFEHLVMINGSALADSYYDWCEKDYEAGKQNFLFFGSGGNIHKGLDLTIEAFMELHQHLWIAAPLETAFFKIYRKDTRNHANIHFLGWIQPRSMRYYNLMKICNYCILPSCSEGQAQSVVEAMNQGLIPMVSRATGLNVDGFGFYLDPPTISTIQQNVVQVSNLPTSKCQDLSRLARLAAKTTYAEPNFRQSFRMAVQQLIKQADS